LKAEFSNARSIQVRFDDVKIDINGSAATMTGIRNYSLLTQDGQRLATVTRTTLALRRSGDSWHIERVSHQAR
jgi:hypothetical protein